MISEEKLEQAKNWNLRSNIVMGFGMAMTVPVIHIWMIQHISADFYKIVVFIQEVLALVSFFLLDKKNDEGDPINLIRIRMYFVPIVIVDVILFLLSNAMYFIPEARFILITVLDGTSSVIWLLVMKDLFNQVMCGTKLTVFMNKLQMADRVGAVAGITILLFIDMSLEVALVIQTLAYLYMGWYDVRIYKLLSPELPEYK